MPASRHLQKLVEDTASALGRRFEDVLPFLKILEENWYDTVESVRTISVADLQNLGVPLRFARELMALAQGNTPSPPSPPAVAASEPPARAPPAPLPPAPPAPPRSGGGRSGNLGPEPRQTGRTPAVVPPRKANPRPAQPAQPAPPAHPPAQPPAQPPAHPPAQPPAQPPQPPAQPPQPTKAPAPPAAFARGPLPKKAEGESKAPPAAFARGALPKKAEDESKGDQKGNWSNWRNEPNEKNDWDRRDRGKGSSSNSNQWNSWQSHPKTKGNTSSSKGSQEKEWDWNNANSKNGSSSWYKSGGEHYHSDNHNPKGKNKGANTSPAKQVPKLFTHKIFIDIEDPDPSFNLNTRLVGQNGQNVKHIREITGATVNLSGKGTADRANADENLHVLLQSHDPHTLDEAVKITNDLIDTVLEQYATFHAEKETEETDSWKGSGKAGKNRGKFARRYSNQQKNYNNSHFEEPAPKRSRGY